MTTFPFLRRLTAVFAAALLFAGAPMLSGCDLFEIDDQPDPNGPSIEDILETASLSQMRDLAIGTQAASRVDMDLYLIDVGVIGREYYRFSSADPRFTSDLLGQAGVLDNNSFFTTRPWGARYATIRNACTLLQALDVTTEPDISEAQKTAARGFANTWIAHQLLLNLNLTYNNGIRVEVCPLGETPPVVAPVDAALDDIAEILDAAAADLQTAAEAEAEFFFPVLMGGGFDSPASFRTFNRAVAARVAAYNENWERVLTLVGASFLDGDLDTGALHVFSTGAGDLTNPFFIDPQNPAGDAIIAHPSYVNDIAEGDDRISKVQERFNDDGDPNPATLDDLSGRFGVFRYESNIAPIPIIREAELLLLRAEANIQLGNFDDAIDDLNTIRSAAGLADYDGDESEGALIDELLRQRRYELYAEGHRWIDVRRYDRLDSLPIDREGDEVFEQFPIPANENV